MSTTPLLFLVSYSSLLVLAAPNKSTQEEGLIGPENLNEDEPELISTATTCQTAILRCCSPNTPTTDATWRCFEKNSCGGLFAVQTRSNNALGACAFLSKVEKFIVIAARILPAFLIITRIYLHTLMQVKELVDEEDNTDSTVSVRTGGPNPFREDEHLAKTHTDGSSQTHSFESSEESSKLDRIFRNPTTQQNPSIQIAFASNGCHGGSHKSCIEDAEEGGCGALEQLDHQAYVQCVHHCVQHCKSPEII
jgi:hypothetical protein